MESIETDEISLLRKLLVLWNGKKLILFITFISAIASGIYAFNLPLIYKAECYFLPPNQDTNRISSVTGNMMGNTTAVTSRRVGGVADLAGLPQSVTGGQMIVGILKRNSVLDEIIERFDLMEVYQQGSKFRMRGKLLGQILEATEDNKSGLITVSVLDEDPKRAADMANAFVEVLQAKMLDLSLNEAVQRRIFFEEQLEKSREAMNKAETEMLTYQRESGSAIPETQMQARLLSITNLRQQIVEKNAEISALLTYARPDNPKVRAARSQLSTLMEELARLEEEQKTSTPQLSVEYQRYAMNLHLAVTAYEVLLKQYENAKIDEAQGFFPLQVVDYATPPDVKFKPGRAKILLIGTFLGFVGGCMIVVLREFYKNIKARLKAYMPEPEREPEREPVRHRKSLLPFVFVIFAVCVIFFLTFQSQPDTSAVSGKFQSILESLFGYGNVPEWVKSMSFLRAFAHVPLYLFLGLSAYASFRLYGLTVKRTIVIAFLLSACVGLADESIKIFIPGREFDLVDWVLDVTGILAGILLSVLINVIFGRRSRDEEDSQSD